MLTTRGFHNQHFTASVSQGAALEDIWGRVLTPPDTPTSPSPCSAAGPFPPLVFPQSSEATKSPQRDKERHQERVEERPGESPEQPTAAEANPTSTGWSLRSRRHRLSTRPVKRLFTPAIKKLLKGWLVRRRDNPYPSRAEKEALATRTGLTYMQVCNWFANWRRKLRDCARPEGGDGPGHGPGEEQAEGPGSWAELIRRYNALAAAPDASTAQEHFSISSSDSIWAADGDDDELRSASGTFRGSSEAQQNAYVSSTTTDLENRSDVTKPRSSRTSSSRAGRVKRKLLPSEDGDDDTVSSWPVPLQAKRIKQDNQGLQHLDDDAPGCASGSALLLSKWLESAARYQPSTPSTAAPPSSPTSRLSHSQKAPSGWGIASVAVEHTLEGRHREELDAAEALAFLSSLHFR